MLQPFDCLPGRRSVHPTIQGYRVQYSILSGYKSHFQLLDQLALNLEVKRVTSQRSTRRRKNFNLGSCNSSRPENASTCRNCISRDSIQDVAIQKERCLETCPFGLAQILTRTVFVDDVVEPPCSCLRVPVPGYVDSRTGFILQRNDCRGFVRETGPVVPKATVILDAFTQEARIKIRMENGCAVRTEFGEGTFRSPVYEDVAVGQELSASLRFGEEAI